MTHVLHRQLGRPIRSPPPPRARSSSTVTANAISTPPAARPFRAWAMAIPMCSPRCAGNLPPRDYAHTSFFTSEASEALAEDLIAHAPPG